MIIAAIDPGFIIYLFFVVVWALIRISKQGKRNKQRQQAQPNPAEPRRRPPVVGDDLREMLETLTGQKVDMPRAPPPPAPTPPPLAAPDNRRRASRPRPQREAAPPRTAPAYFRADNSPVEGQAPAVVSVQTRHSTTMSTASMPSAGLAFRSSIIGSSKHMTPPDWAPNLKRKQALRHAILNQVILGPPKALER